MRLTKFNPETGQYEYIEKAKTLTEFRAQRKAVIQRLGELEDKASEVAEEIFEEIENILDRHSIAYLKVGQICGEHYYDGVMQFDIAELKKKYTEGEG